MTISAFINSIDEGEKGIDTTKINPAFAEMIKEVTDKFDEMCKQEQYCYIPVTLRIELRRTIPVTMSLP
jgi:ribosomal protein L11